MKMAPTTSAPAPYAAVAYDDASGELILLDQTLLPRALRYLHLHDLDAICEAIHSLRVRGAPAIGVAAAYGLCAVARHRGLDDVGALRTRLDEDARRIASTRPTAVNLMAAMARLTPLLVDGKAATSGALVAALEAEAKALHREEEAATERMGQHALALFHDGDGVITHCNTGPLAAPGIGTALGTVIHARRHGKALHVYADETRPLLQGGRLTTWECLQHGVPCTLLTDGMAAVVLRAGKVQAAVVGADRIAANGDAANKIGTYGLSVLCRHHGVPFYVVAPFTTVDLTTVDGTAIPIEQRNADEVRGAFGVHWAPDTVPCFNPAFDVTPAALITAIVTDRGLIKPPFGPGLAALVQR